MKGSSIVIVWLPFVFQSQLSDWFDRGTCKAMSDDNRFSRLEKEIATMREVIAQIGESVIKMGQKLQDCNQALNHQHEQLQRRVYYLEARLRSLSNGDRGEI